MPTYEYECKSCKHRFEAFQSITAKPLKSCPSCSKRSVQRVITGGAGVLFKGTGFYQTDYRSKSYQDSAKKDSGKDTPAKPSSEAGSCGPSDCKQPGVCKPDKK